MKKALLYAATATMALTGSAVLAQTAPLKADSSEMGQIVVTARRTAEVIRDVPLAVTAMSEVTLRERRIATVTDLSRSAPGLSVTPPTTDPFTPVMALRGQVQNDVSLINLDSSTAFYIDEMYLARPSALQSFGLYDVERVEVLRGPQGTLFGRNAAGGNLRYITKKAGGEFEGYVRGAYGKFDHRELEGAVNVPIVGDQLALRVSGKTLSEDGFGRSLNTGRQYGDLHNNAWRANLTVKPSDRIRFNFGYHQFLGNSGNQVLRVAFLNPLVVAAFPTQSAQSLTLRNDNLSAINSHAKSSNRVYIASGSVDLNDSLTADVTYGRFEMHLEQLLDLVPIGVPGGNVSTDVHNAQDSVEGRLSGKFFDNRLQLQAGGYYMKEHGDTNLIQTTLVSGIGASSNLRVQVLNTGSNESKAMFAQGSYAVTDALKITLGGRYTWEDRTTTDSQLVTVRAANLTRCGIDNVSAAAQRILIGACQYGGTDKEHYFSYLASADYHLTNDQMLYAKTARANRAGGINPRGTAPDSFATFSPEQVTEYEVGYKGRPFDALDINLALFHDVRKNGQVSAVVVSPVTGTNITLIANLVNTNVNGAEAEAQLRVTDFLTLDGNLAVIDKRLPLVSKFRYLIGATVTHDLPGAGTLSGRLEYTGQSAQDSVPQSCTATGDVRVVCANYLPVANTVDAYGLLNARVAYKFGSRDVEIAAYGRNLGNKKYDTYKFDSRNGGAALAYVGSPATYGIEVRAGF